MTKEELRQRIRNACDCVIASEAELTDIDSRFGDADHGLTMTKIGKAIKAAAEESEVEFRPFLTTAPWRCSA